MITWTTRNRWLHDAYGHRYRHVTVVRAEWQTGYCETTLPLCRRVNAIAKAKDRMLRCGIIDANAL